MKILVIGGGGREHALIWKLSRSKHITKIYCSPGNAGIAGVAECIDVSPQNIGALIDFVKYEWIDLTIICSQTLVTREIVDSFERNGCRVFGLTREASLLGSSRESTKDFMKRHRLPTAEYRVFSSYLLAQDYVQLKGLPLVIKTNGYPGDTGVFPVATREDASSVLKRVMKEKIHKDGGNRVIIEEHLNGERMSIVTIADGRTILPVASIYKFRGKQSYSAPTDPTVFGSYSPVPPMTKDVEKNIMEKVMQPVHKALTAEGIPFKGFLSADLVMKPGGTSLLELQFGFGDLEPQTIMPGLKADIGEAILSASEGRLSEFKMKADKSMSVCMALFSERLPGREGTSSKVEGLEAAEQLEEVFLFHENTVFENSDIVTPGGTALYVTATGRELKEAKTRAYRAAGGIHFEGIQYRKDIGDNISPGGENL